MTNKKRLDPLLVGEVPSLNLIELPMVIRTITVDGKRLSSALYRQLTTEDLINAESGSLQGPIFGYFHIHEKHCPAAWHRHVLWAKSDRPCLACVVNCEDDPGYQQQERLSQIKKRKLIALLALLLASPSESRYTLEESSTTVSKLEIEGYTLYVPSAIVRLLTRLQHAREQVKADLKQLQRNYASDDTLKKAIEAAEEVLREVKEQGAEIGHSARWFHESPARYSEQEEDDDEEYDDIFMRLTLYEGWISFPKASTDKTLLYWKPRDRHGRGSQKDLTLSEDMENLLALHVQALRVVLATQALQKHLEAMASFAHHLIQDLQIHNTNEKERSEQKKENELELPPPKTVWHYYNQEKERFEAVTLRWRESLEEVRLLGQLFLLT